VEVVGSEQAAEAVGEREQQCPADEDPRLGIRIAILRDAARLLRAPDGAGDVVVNLSELAAEEATDLLVLPRLGERLNPERHRLDAAGRVELARRLTDGCDGVLVTELVDLRVKRGAEGLPRPVEARQIQLALAREVAVDDGLGDAYLPRDVRGGRPAVAALGEDAQRRVEDRLPALSGRQA
jgi:hypothetical protein